jgi:hypothetical protein
VARGLARGRRLKKSPLFASEIFEERKLIEKYRVEFTSPYDGRQRALRYTSYPEAWSKVIELLATGHLEEDIRLLCTRSIYL